MMTSHTPYLSTVWIDDQGDMLLAAANRSNSDGQPPLEWRPDTIQADDVFRHFYEQVLCRVGPTRATEQAQRELRQHIAQPVAVQHGAENGYGVWIVDNGNPVRR